MTCCLSICPRCSPLACEAFERADRRMAEVWRRGAVVARAWGVL